MSPGDKHGEDDAAGLEKHRSRTPRKVESKKFAIPAHPPNSSSPRFSFPSVLLSPGERRENSAGDGCFQLAGAVDTRALAYYCFTAGRARREGPLAG